MYPVDTFSRALPQWRWRAHPGRFSPGRFPHLLERLASVLREEPQRLASALDRDNPSPLRYLRDPTWKTRLPPCSHFLGPPLGPFRRTRAPCSGGRSTLRNLLAQGAAPVPKPNAFSFRLYHPVETPRRTTHMTDLNYVLGLAPTLL